MFGWLKSVGNWISTAFSATINVIKPVVKAAYSWVANGLSKTKSFFNIFAKEKGLEIQNNTNTDFEISVGDIDNFDWIRDGRPDNEEIFNGKTVASKTIMNTRFNLNRLSEGNFTITLNHRNGLKDTFRIDGIYKSSDAKLTHRIKSHLITIFSSGEKLIIKVENTWLQIENEFAEKLKKEGIKAMREKCFEDAVRNFKEASETAKEAETIDSIKKYTSMCYDSWAQDIINGTHDLREEGRSLNEENSLEAVCKYQEVLKIYKEAEKKIPGERFKEATEEVETVIDELIEIECSQMRFTSRKKNNESAFGQQQSSTFQRQF